MTIRAILFDIGGPMNTEVAQAIIWQLTQCQEPAARRIYEAIWRRASERGLTACH